MDHHHYNKVFYDLDHNFLNVWDGQYCNALMVLMAVSKQSLLSRERVSDTPHGPNLTHTTRLSFGLQGSLEGLEIWEQSPSPNFGVRGPAGGGVTVLIPTGH